MTHRAARLSPHRGTRLRRADATGPDRLESLSAAFALLAQRRARLLRQIELLGRQQSAARASLAKIEAKLAELSGHITALPASDPATRVAPPTAPAPQARRVAAAPGQAVPLQRGPEPAAPGAAPVRRTRSVLLTY